MSRLFVLSLVSFFVTMSSVKAQSAIRIYENSTVSSTIDEFLKGSVPFSMTNSQFEKEWLKKFALEWTDKFKRSARGTSKIKYNELISKESIFKFRSNKFESLKLMIFNQGDEGAITKTKFNERIRKTVGTMTRLIGKKPTFKPNAGASGRNMYFWVNMPYLYRIEYSSSMVRESKLAQLKFKPQYVRVIISQGSPKINAVNIDKVGNNILTQLELKELITKKDDELPTGVIEEQPATANSGERLNFDNSGGFDGQIGQMKQISAQQPQQVAQVVKSWVDGGT